MPDFNGMCLYTLSSLLCHVCNEREQEDLIGQVLTDFVHWDDASNIREKLTAPLIDTLIQSELILRSQAPPLLPGKPGTVSRAISVCCWWAVGGGHATWEERSQWPNAQETSPEKRRFLPQIPATSLLLSFPAPTPPYTCSLRSSFTSLGNSALHFSAVLAAGLEDLKNSPCTL